MAWVKDDDRMDDTPKVKRAWRRNRASIGLWSMAKTYSARHETDGLVPLEWVEDKIPDDGERNEALAVMVDVGLFDALPAGEKSRVKVTRVRKGKPEEITVTYGPCPEPAYIVHDYLEYNEAKCEAEARRRADAERKTKARAKDTPATPPEVPADSSGSPDGQAEDSPRIPFRVQKSRPDPTRPDQLPPHPPSGGRQRDIDRWEREMRDWRQVNPIRESPEWDAILAAIGDEVDAATFNIWIAPLHLHVDGDSLIVGAPQRGQARWVLDRFGRQIAAAAPKPVQIIDCGCPTLAEAVA